MLKRICSVIVASAVLLLSSCDKGPEYSHAELAIPLDGSFARIENDDFDAAFSDGDVAIAILRISFAAALVEGIPETLDGNEFGRFWLNKCNRAATMQKAEGVDFCEYFEFVDDVEYYYLASFYRSMNAYFVVLFACESGEEDGWRVKFLDYATGVYFTDNQLINRDIA